MAARLDRPLLEASATTRPAGWVRKACSWHGPDPSLTLLVFMCVVGCTVLAEQKTRSPKAMNGGEDVAALVTISSGESDTAHGLYFYVPVAVVVVVFFCQLAVQRFFERALPRALATAVEACLGAEMELGNCQVAPHFGWFSIRRCCISLSGHEVEALVIKNLKGQVSIGRFLRSLGRELPVLHLTLEDVHLVWHEACQLAKRQQPEQQQLPAAVTTKVWLSSIDVTGLTIYRAGEGSQTVPVLQLEKEAMGPMGIKQVVDLVARAVLGALSG
eukprot:TRINITY_DN45600_c0_g1_i1.p1 TRINITY_DN45600_c0_g1~~TRINITY_DN45600_c0_g1_i1.p1  ORF type:complete len:273 (+),score=54.85 TRINITY_DN45600_c0_g1_i1:36-854(+)